MIEFLAVMLFIYSFILTYLLIIYKTRLDKQDSDIKFLIDVSNLRLREFEKVSEILRRNDIF